ncbi:nagb/rpia/CoA transferase-like protein [Zopfia rhizophila CBS 207.26]|uniref:Nagb/rpia/CoA transferase-like protein n=1 Tax=Zopfia rhizophila CBS 207.26 TaxID=1314779 RepID=A0A6A6EUE0_9PEZI|nr:nagb/rpia/CoA transferase-like protein [Zopfia rhizophila CBS 207.26]
MEHSESSTATHIPAYPAPSSDPPSLKNEFDSHLQSTVTSLKNDFVSGARAMADSSLYNLSTLVSLAAATASTKEELWDGARHAAKQLSLARPAMSAAITACLLRALSSIQETLSNSSEEKSEMSVEELAQLALSTIERILEERKTAFEKLGESFSSWVTQRYNLTQSSSHELRILTLSNSSSIRTALLSLLSNSPTLTLHLTILESRPRFEGADMALALQKAAPDPNKLKITLAPDCAVGTVSSNIQIVLLGADRITSSGSVSNKVGSLAAALSAKHHSTSTRVVVASDIDKVVAPGAEDHLESHSAEEVTKAWSADTRTRLGDKVQVFGEWFEWVNEGLIDVYVTEKGALSKGEVGRLGEQVGALERVIFGE